jgi:hypothetical protein
MQAPKLGIYVLAACLGLTTIACSPSNKRHITPKQQFASLTPQNQNLWLSTVCGVFHESNDFFSADNIENEAAAIFEFKLQQLSEPVEPNNEVKQLVTAPCANSNIKPLGKANSNPAQIERARMRQTLVNTFLFTLLGDTESILALPKQDDVLQSLNNMVNTYPVFNDATAELYDLRLEQKTFAFERKGENNVRAYIAFNLSFDVQEMPLPLGFMSSTKVTVWRSDLPELDTFVTNQAFVMPALSAIIVIVGAN